MSDFNKRGAERKGNSKQENRSKKLLEENLEDLVEGGGSEE